MKPIYSLVVALVAMTWAGCSKKTAEPTVVPPTLGTVAISDITPTSARGSSSLKTVGAGGGSVSTISEFGLCYGPKDSPTTADSKVKTGSTADKPQDISATLTGLTAATTYYVRSYAIHQDGTVYGDQASFQTGSYKAPTVTTGDPLDVTRTDLSIIGDIKEVGTSEVTQYGHVLSEGNQTPALSDVKTELGGANAPKGFKSTYNNLKPNTTYYVRAYATNATGGTGYGVVRTVKTTNDLPPTVETGAPSTVSLLYAYIDGVKLVTLGTAPVTQFGLCWSNTNQNPTPADSRDERGPASGPTSFIASMPNLTGGTTYYYRAYGTNRVGTGYGDVKTLTTRPYTPPVFLSTAAQWTVSSMEVVFNFAIGAEREQINTYGVVENNSTDKNMPDPAIDNVSSFFYKAQRDISTTERNRLTASQGLSLDLFVRKGGTAANPTGLDSGLTITDGSSAKAIYKKLRIYLIGASGRVYYSSVITNF